MIEKLESIKKEAVEAVKKVSSLAELEAVRERFFSRKTGTFTVLAKNMKGLSDTERKTAGQKINEVKLAIESELEHKKNDFEHSAWDAIGKNEAIDVTQPMFKGVSRGHTHPMSIVHTELEDLFTSMGFMLLDGPELESEHYNFDALNIPGNHPARDSQDTFFIKDHTEWVMRTHTSPVQIRAMQKYGAPLRAVVSGRCFRNESTDASHEHTFYQMEGIVIDKNITIANLIGVMKELLKGVLRKDVEVRLRPGYFPFVEPGFELDMKCLVCGGSGCGACKHSGWIETLPCGLVHPRVIEAGGLDPKVWSGFAFGLGSMRLCMQKYGIEDIRQLHGGNLSFLEQF
ncbi:MAG TPA: phenylalanine--tRNA ligase subunit alpha [Candidatus Magasanikbacteria bacterium]|nr:phenylalanine--tRNA ligase subunit alpha [Candidatus Magasanikbacteria bacterium]